MTPDQLRDVLEEIAGWTLEERRSYIANLQIVDEAAAQQVKQGLIDLWAKRVR